MDFVKPVDCVAQLVSSRELAPKVFSYIFEIVEGDFKFKAGQFVNVKFDDIQRAYSFASKPDPKRFELCIELIDGGRGSAYFANLQIGDKINMKAPFGMCSIKEENTNDLLMVATGTGIAPIKSILEDMAARDDKRKIDVYFGVRHETNLFYLEELKELESLVENMTLNLCLSQPQTDDWHGLAGRVTHNLENYDFSHMPDVYICGSQAMIMEVRKMALDNGIDKKKIHLEIFDV